VGVASLSVACGARQPAAPPGDPVEPTATATEVASPTEGATDGAGGGTDTGGPCDLLTTAEVAAEVGPVSEGVLIEGSGCQWAAQGGQSSVALAVLPIPAATCLMSRPPAAPAVDGLGVEAWWEFVQAETAVGILVACSEDRQVNLTMSGGDDEGDLRNSAETLARMVLARI
jgi:hypothetical protein